MIAKKVEILMLGNLLKIDEKGDLGACELGMILRILMAVLRRWPKF